MYLSKKSHQVVVILLLILIWAPCISCKNKLPRNKLYASIPESTVVEGKRLASVYCQGCHELPDPALLDVYSWENGVLPNMGPRLGIFKHNFRYYPSMARDPFLDSNYYPKNPLLTPSQWQTLMSYYMATSPDSLPSQNRPKIAGTSIPGFEILLPGLKYQAPAVSFIGINTSPSHPILVNDIGTANIYGMAKDYRATDSVISPGNIVDIEFADSSFYLLNIGQLNPTNAKLGSMLGGRHREFQALSVDSNQLVSRLSRPVDFCAGDLNKDGKTDFVICEFGNLEGSLSWIENKGAGTYLRHELSHQSGAIKAWLSDYNKDGFQDIWVLFAQGNESVVLFTNLGNGQFEQKKLVVFPAVYGSSYFELADFNNDGFSDILYTAGDNADFSMVLKPYHGVYVYLNDGKNNFRQRYFFPIHGCFKAMARDFDNDGDLDIAAISFFADYAKQPEEGFVFLKNNGNFVFEPYSDPRTQVGRWLTMDVGDVDKDGKIDIVLGNFSIRPADIKPNNDWKKGPPLLILKNTANTPGSNN